MGHAGRRISEDMQWLDEKSRHGGGNESGPLVMLQPHQHVARDLFRLVFMQEMSRVGDRHHRQVHQKG